MDIDNRQILRAYIYQDERRPIATTIITMAVVPSIASSPYRSKRVGLMGRILEYYLKNSNEHYTDFFTDFELTKSGKRWESFNFKYIPNKGERSTNTAQYQ